jgi:hypothetical protein
MSLPEIEYIASKFTAEYQSILSISFFELESATSKSTAEHESVALKMQY